MDILTVWRGGLRLQRSRGWSRSSGATTSATAPTYGDRKQMRELQHPRRTSLIVHVCRTLGVIILASVERR